MGYERATFTAHTIGIGKQSFALYNVWFVTKPLAGKLAAHSFSLLCHEILACGADAASPCELLLFLCDIF